ncbi:MAG: type IX secretion system membrane protein PorP/SprF, partial [Bacteroidota bacterium]|nr:type IX secretion system membrane protein PorP/SprF [Bacteroidota bacterium]
MVNFIRIISVLFLVVVYNEMKAQQLPLFTQYREFQGIINPASISHDYLFWEGYTTSFGISYRNQWSKIKGGPVTSTIRAE